MFFPTSKMVVQPLTPAIGPNASLTMYPAVSTPPVAKLHFSLEVRSKKEKSAAEETVASIRRREIIHFTAASLSAIALFLAKPSEARVRKPEVRRKIMEKLEEERKKFGASKNNIAEKPKEMEPSVPIFPDLQKTLAGSVVDVTLP